MKVSKKIREKILKDNDFSLDVAKLLGIQQYSVKELAKRNSDKLMLYPVVEFYKKKGLAKNKFSNLKLRNMSRVLTHTLDTGVFIERTLKNGVESIKVQSQNEPKTIPNLFQVFSRKVKYYL